MQINLMNAHTIFFAVYAILKLKAHFLAWENYPKSILQGERILTEANFSAMFMRPYDY